jgi:hypothetical protein
MVLLLASQDRSHCQPGQVRGDWDVVERNVQAVEELPHGLSVAARVLLIFKSIDHRLWAVLLHADESPFLRWLERWGA